MTRERLVRNITARKELGLFARRERTELAEHINRDQDNLTRTDAEVQALTGNHDTAVQRQLTWLAEHGDRSAACSSPSSTVTGPGRPRRPAGRPWARPQLTRRDAAGTSPYA